MPLADGQMSQIQGFDTLPKSQALQGALPPSGGFASLKFFFFFVNGIWILAPHLPFSRLTTHNSRLNTKIANFHMSALEFENSNVMNSIGFLADIYIILVSILLAIVLALLAWRVYSVFIRRKPRRPLINADHGWFVKTAKGLIALSVLLLLICIPPYLYVGSAFKSIIPAWLNHALAGSMMLLAALELRLGFTVSESLLQKKLKKAAAVLVVLVMFPLSVYLTAYLPQIFTFPDEEESYIVELPVRGTWSAGHAGGSELVNYHNAHRSQQYAIDIVKVDERGRFYERPGNELEQVFSFGEPVYAPASGIIVAAVDTLPNHEITLEPSETEFPAGNHVVIRFEEDRYIFLAHLKPGSLQAAEGDSVTAGAPIGTIGNSGNSSWPHLHMHIQDRPELDYNNAIAFPFRFTEMQRKRWGFWRHAENGFLIRNDLFKD
jgi:hypothetical protein